MKFTTKQLTQTALLLAICVASQFFKNTSIFITGPIINAALILEVLSVGLYGGIILSVITPITSFFITGSPVMSAIPLILPAVMIGNIVLVLFIWYFHKKTTFSSRLYVGMFFGAFAKSVCMGILIALILLPLFGGNFPAKQLFLFKFTFSIAQFITAIIGSIYAAILWIPLKKTMETKN